MRKVSRRCQARVLVPPHSHLPRVTEDRSPPRSRGTLALWYRSFRLRRSLRGDRRSSLRLFPVQTVSQLTKFRLPGIQFPTLPPPASVSDRASPERRRPVG